MKKASIGFSAIIACAVTALSLGFGACDGQSSKITYVPVNYELKKDDLQATIGAYWCPPAKEEYYQSIAGGGIKQMTMAALFLGANPLYS